MSDAPSLRETIESAIEEHTPDAPEPEAVDVQPANEPMHEPAPANEPMREEEAPRARDESGRFAKKPPEKAEAAPKATDKPEAEPPGKPKAAPAARPPRAGELAAPVAPKEPEVQAVTVRPPQSWKPGVRELAAKLPAEYRPILEEANRVDNEAKRAMQESHQSRQFASTVVEQLRPYEGIARANGQDAMAFAAEGLQERAAIYAGAPQHALAAASKLLRVLVQRFGDGVYEHLNGAMAGQPAGAALPQAQHQPVDVRGEVERVLQEQRAQFEEQTATTALEEFMATGPEFVEDVWQDMQIILRAAAQSGNRNMTYQQAYDRACRMNEEVAATLDGRKATAATRAKAPTVQRAKVAGSSIKASPGTEVTRGTGPRTLRQTIEDAVAEQGS